MTRNKYNAKPTVVDDIKFASAREARRYGELKLLVQGAVIRNLELQPEFPLVINGRPVLIRSKGYPNGRKAKYKADFAYSEGYERIVEDVKSPATITEASKLRIAVAEAIYGIRVRLI